MEISAKGHEEVAHAKAVASTYHDMKAESIDMKMLHDHEVHAQRHKVTLKIVRLNSCP